MKVTALKSFQPKAHPGVWHQRVEASRSYRITWLLDEGVIMEVGGTPTLINTVELDEYCFVER